MICEATISAPPKGYVKMIKTVSPATLNEWLNAQKCILIDVREEDEYRTEHIQGARFHPLSTLPQNFTISDFSPNDVLVFQCRSGKRSDTACRMVSEWAPNHAHIYNLEGGILGWKTSGFPVTTE